MRDSKKERIGLFVFLIVAIFIANVATTLAADKWPESDQSAELSDDTVIAPDAATQANYVGPHIVINVAARQLSLFDQHDNLIKKYQIAVGQPIFKTPLGRRWIDQIVWNPWWIPPPSEWAKDDKPTPPGPLNPLGPVKMKLSSAIMIHGTNKPSTIGRAASHGCMRMHSEQAKELARWLQTNVTDKGGAEVFSQYDNNKDRSYYVMLTKRIPVDITYDIVDLNENTLVLYKDVYGRIGNKVAHVKEFLAKQGYDVSDLNEPFLKKLIAKSEVQDVAAKLSELDVKPEVDLEKVALRGE